MFQVQKLNNLNYFTAVSQQKSMIIIKICPYFCKFCTTDTCTQCQNDRENLPTCECESSKIEIPELLVCTRTDCEPQCNGCDINFNQCVTCLDPGKQPPLCSNTCQDGYFITGTGQNKVCSMCDPQCETCQNTATNCTSCPINYLYDSGTKTCTLQCAVQCNGCDIVYDNCILCTDVNKIAPLCQLCITKKYLDNSNICQDCDIQCAECYLQSNNCYICQNNLMQLPDCLECINGYYKDINGDCQICTSPCLECIDNTNKCTKCINNYSLSINTCSSLTCQIQCNNCIDTADNCVECVDINKIKPNCQDCLSSFYKDNTNTCQPCDKKCKQCNSSSSICTQCALLRKNDIPNCTCIQSYYQNVDGDCVECDQNCLECQNTPTNCTACKSNFYLKNNQCLQCDYKCSECIDEADNCTECNIDNRNNNFPICSCLDGYYEDQIAKACLQCLEPCQKCTSISTNCTECMNNYQFDQQNQCQIIPEVIINGQNQPIQAKEDEKEEEVEPASQAAIETTKRIEQASQLVVSSFVLLALFGYFYMLVSIIDFTQYLYMLMYIDVKYNQNLLLFYKALQKFAIPYIPHFFKHWAYDEKQTREDDPAPETFTKHGYYSFFLENVGLTFTICLVPAAVLIILHIIDQLLIPFENKIIKLIRNKIQRTRIRMKYSSFIEIILMEFVNLSAACCMQVFYLPKLQYDFTGIITYIFWIITSILVFMYPVYFQYTTFKYLKQRTEKFRQHFGHFWDGLNTEKASQISFNYMLHYRKTLYSLIIVFLYEYQYLQLVILIFFHIAIIIYMLISKPFDDPIALYINLITEIMFIMILIITIGSCTKERCTNDGWIIIFSSLFVLLMHISYIVFTIIKQKAYRLKILYRRGQLRNPGERRKALPVLVFTKKFQKILDNYTLEKIDEVLKSQSSTSSNEEGDNDKNIQEDHEQQLQITSSRYIKNNSQEDLQASKLQQQQAKKSLFNEQYKEISICSPQNLNDSKSGSRVFAKIRKSKSRKTKNSSTVFPIGSSNVSLVLDEDQGTDIQNIPIGFQSGNNLETQFQKLESIENFGKINEDMNEDNNTKKSGSLNSLGSSSGHNLKTSSPVGNSQQQFLKSQLLSSSSGQVRKKQRKSKFKKIDVNQFMNN